jgi:hypothetical protein
MDIAVFPRQELPTALGALRAFHPAPSEAQQHFIEVIGRLHGVDVDGELPEPSIEETAAVIADPHRRKRLVQLAMVTTMIDGEIDSREAASVERFARALQVDERATRTMRQLASQQNFMARLDLTRRILGRFAGEAWREERWAGLRKMVAPVTDGGEDVSTAWRYKQLGLLPLGTFGRAFWEHVTVRQFAFPGESGGIPERMVFHDLGHVLAGYDTNPQDEIQQAAFQSGFVRNDGFAFLFFGLVQFHLGVKVTPIAEAELGLFDVDKVMTALARGAACTVDLSDHWDFWPLMPLPLERVRADLGIPPLAASGRA